MTDHSLARGAVIEIVEQRKPGDHDSPAGDIIVPTEIRINGQPLLASADHPVKVHEVSINGGDAVYVTLTLFAKRVSIGHEDTEQAGGIPVGLRVGRSASHEIGTAETVDGVPALLRAVADQMEADRG